MNAPERAPAPGRSCPLDYRYDPAALGRAPDLEAETLYVVGGLYGNVEALDTVLALAAGEPGPVTVAFNGDFHWFDVDPADFESVQRAVLAHPAIRGNVETELSRDAPEAGCGCAYPDWVDDAVVERSNAIMARLRDTARVVPGAGERLAALPMHLVAEVGGALVAVVHGDADSLAGWSFSHETLGAPGGTAALAERLAAAGVDAFASSHTCLPVYRRIEGAGVLANNGSTGMPNFRGTRFGLLTRISTRAPRGLDVVAGTALGPVRFDAVAVHYDHVAWTRRFLRSWPPGSDAHASYWARIVDGPDFARGDAGDPA